MEKPVFAELYELTDKYVATRPGGEYTYVGQVVAISVAPKVVASGKVEFSVFPTNLPKSLKPLNRQIVEWEKSQVLTLGSLFDLWFKTNEAHPLPEFTVVWKKYLESDAIKAPRCATCSLNFTGGASIQCCSDTGGCDEWMHGEEDCSGISCEELQLCIENEAAVYKCPVCARQDAAARGLAKMVRNVKSI